MSTFSDLGIRTYEDYKRNKHTVFDIVYGMFEEYVDKHPEFVKEAFDKQFKNFVTCKDLKIGENENGQDIQLCI